MLPPWAIFLIIVAVLFIIGVTILRVFMQKKMRISSTGMRGAHTHHNVHMMNSYGQASQQQPRIVHNSVVMTAASGGPMPTQYGYNRGMGTHHGSNLYPPVGYNDGLPYGSYNAPNCITATPGV